MNIYEQQRSNIRRAWLVMLAFVGLFVFLGAGFDWFAVGAGGAPVPVGTVLALTVGGVSALSGYFLGDRAVLASSHAVPIDKWLVEYAGRPLSAFDRDGQTVEGRSVEPGPQAPSPSRQPGAPQDDQLRVRQLENVVDEMAIASGLPRPSIYVIPDEDPNAFATGRDPAHASLAVTHGLLRMMTRDQLQGVVAHEMSHIRNYDIRLMTVVAALVGAIGLLSDWARRGWFYGSRGRSRDSKSGGGAIFFVVWIVAIIFAPLLAQLAALAVSRRREYLADASGAELTRNPLALASALETIEEAVEPTRLIKTGTAHLCIADPQGHRIGLKEGFLADLLATHPPMDKRIAALKDMAFERRDPTPARAGR